MSSPVDNSNPHERSRPRSLFERLSFLFTSPSKQAPTNPAHKMTPIDDIVSRTGRPVRDER